MSNWFNDVTDFHKAFGQRVGETPALPDDPKERVLRMDLLAEEIEEYYTAEKEQDLVGVADALTDIIYIALGTAVAYGIPLDKCFAEVHRSNMAKLVGGKVFRREDGKIMKPEGWTPPDLESILKS